MRHRTRPSMLSWYSFILAYLLDVHLYIYIYTYTYIYTHVTNMRTSHIYIYIYYTILYTVYYIPTVSPMVCSEHSRARIYVWSRICSTGGRSTTFQRLSHAKGRNFQPRLKRSWEMKNMCIHIYSTWTCVLEGMILLKIFKRFNILTLNYRKRWWLCD